MSESTSSTSAPRSTSGGQVAADEAEAAGDHHAAAAVERAVGVAHERGARGGRGAPGPPAGAATVLAPDDQRPPQLQHVDAGAEDAPEVEELRLAVRAVVVVHRHLGDAEAGVLDLLHHLEADDAAVLLERAPSSKMRGASAEVAVHVAHLQAEQQLDRVVVERPMTMRCSGSERLIL
jgi:hypothetical protein